MVYVLLAEGFEECEALIPIDILRRGGLKVKIVGIKSDIITGAHGIKIVCDCKESVEYKDNLEALILPGGMPGTINLENSKYVQDLIDFSVSNNKIIAAICAAPIILGHKGLLNNKMATVFPGYEKELIGARFVDTQVVKDKNIITSYGVGAAFDFGYEILYSLTGNIVDTNKLKTTMKYIK